MKFYPSLKKRSLLTAAALLTGLGCAVQQADAVVTFQFNFADKDGTGLNDTTNSKAVAARAGILDAGQTLGSYFDNTATIVITVTSSNDPEDSTLAHAGSPLADTTGNAGFYRTIVQEKVISNGANDVNGSADDGSMSINIGSNYQYDPNAAIGAGQYDFKGTVIHELTHALGFISIFDANPNLAPGQYSIFDSLLTDASGNPLINPQTYAFDQSKVGVLTGGNDTVMSMSSATGEYFNGPNAKAAYFNLPVPIFSPNPYQNGSSGSHVDDRTMATQYYLMAAAVEGAKTAGMRMPRVFSSGEVGIMKDLGYTMSANIYPAFFNNEYTLINAVYYLSFSNGNYFGYFTYLNDPRFIFHYDLGFEYLFDAGDGKSGIYLYDFTSQHYFYTSPTFPFPYLYDFTLKSVLYYYPDPSNAGRYNTNGTRYFYNFSTGMTFSQ